MNERQQQIIEAATLLFLSEGVGVSTATIAKAAGVSNGTLFNAFPTKQALIDAIYLTTKANKFKALGRAHMSAFDRQTLRQFCDDYLVWGRQNPAQRQVMALLLESGLASEPARQEANDMYAPIGVWFNDAFADGIIRGPSIEFIGQLILFHMDLVITQNLEGDDEDLAFDMLCQSIGLSQ